MPVVLVVGTRPESIKMAPIADELGDDALVVHTGQHTSPGMIQSYRRAHPVELPPIRATSRGDQLGRTVAALDTFFARTRPCVVVVQGDTTSALAGALAANTADIPLLHVEAGLRSFDRRMPEEHNRVLIDHLADLCCAPTSLAAANLHREGLPGERIVITGNPIVEATTRTLPTNPTDTPSCTASVSSPTATSSPPSTARRTSTTPSPSPRSPTRSPAHPCRWCCLSTPGSVTASHPTSLPWQAPTSA